MSKATRSTSIQPISFRLYPEGSFLYCQVNIWPNKKAMHAHDMSSRKSDYEACCGGREQLVVQGNGRIRKRGLFAEANFNRRRLGVEIFSHELTHAAFAFAERRGLKLGDAVNKEYRVSGAVATMNVDGPEERFCYALGQMCHQFAQKCYDLGIYK